MGKKFVGVSEHSSAVRKVAFEISFLSKTLVGDHDIQGELGCIGWTNVNVGDILIEIFARDYCYLVGRVYLI